MGFSLAKNWWSLVIRGLVGIIVGVVTFIRPGMTLALLIFLFAAYALVDGIVDLAGAIHAIAARERWGALMLEGFAGIGAAVVAVLWPKMTLLVLIWVIAAWAIIIGIAEIAAAIRLRRHVSGEWLLVLRGVAAVIFGVLMAAVPHAGALVIAIWFGAFAFIFGIVLVALGFRLRSWDRTLHMGPHGPHIPAPAH
jgi:uncharacterized membrane protein HdeD (DUF308 family)